jgi:membrane protein YqaA with SNARE-associated domain
VITAFASYLALFLAAFLAATIVPAQSEAVLVGLILAGDRSLILLLLVATTGNVLGSVVNWLLGRFIERFRDRPWFPVSRPRLAQAEAWYRRFGIWSLLLSWVPIIGDPLTVVAGVLRTPFLTFLVLVTIAKAGRYLVLAAITLGLM